MPTFDVRRSELETLFAPLEFNRNEFEEKCFEYGLELADGVILDIVIFLRA